MEGRVHAQNDEFGHSWVDTHSHTVTGMHIEKAPANVSVSWLLHRSSLSEPTVPDVIIRSLIWQSGAFEK